LELGELFQKSWLLRLRRAAFFDPSCLSPSSPISPTFTVVSSLVAQLEEKATVEMAHEDVAGVQVYRRQVDNLLDRAAQVKPDKQIEPPLSEAHLGEPTWQLSTEDQEATGHLNQQTRLAAVEIVFREKFYRVLVWPVQGTLLKDWK
jgi:hypothetical protein